MDTARGRSTGARATGCGSAWSTSAGTRASARRKPVYGKTQAEVVSKLGQLQTKRAAGLPIPDDRLTVEVIIRRWLDSLVGRNLAPNTIENYATIARLHVVPALGKKRLTRLSPDDVQRLIREKQAAGLSASHRVADQGRPRPSHQAGRTGDLKNSGSRRTVPLPAPTVEAFKGQRRRQAADRLAVGESWADCGLVFTTAVDTPIDPRNFRRSFDRVVKRADLVGWHPHELRHSAASIMLAQGVPLEVVSEVLGHSSIRITKDVYGHLTRLEGLLADNFRWSDPDLGSDSEMDRDAFLATATGVIEQFPDRSIELKELLVLNDYAVAISAEWHGTEVVQLPEAAAGTEVHLSESMVAEVENGRVRLMRCYR